MSGASAPLVAGGAKLSFSTLQGVVLATDQRSDSYITGAGRTLVIDGSGGGTTSVGTTVVVSRDIWIQDGAGTEHHVRVAEDIPVRVGQELGLVYCSGSVPQGGGKHHAAGGLMSVYVLSTGKVYTILSPASLTKQLLEPPEHMAKSVLHLLLWVFSVFLIAIFGIGLLALAALSLRAFLRSRRRKMTGVAIEGDINAEHRRLLRVLLSEHQERAASKKSTLTGQEQPKIVG